MKRLATSLAGFLLTRRAPRGWKAGARRLRPSGRTWQVAMAAVFLGATMTSGSLGCLAPQWIEGELPPTNRPPSFDLSGVSPVEPIVCLSEQEVPKEFRIDSLVDPDGLDNQILEVRWFLDYTPDTTSPRQLLKERIIPLDAGSTRYEPPLLSSSHIPKAELLPLGSTHRLEVVISDGFDDETKPPLGRALLPTAYAVSHVWIVRYVGDNGCE